MVYFCVYCKKNGIWIMINNKKYYIICNRCKIIQEMIYRLILDDDIRFKKIIIKNIF